MQRSIKDFLLRSLLSLLFALLGCATATKYTGRATNATPTPSATATAENTQEQSDVIDRPTSKSYTGDLSIFEDPKRDDRCGDDD